MDILQPLFCTVPRGQRLESTLVCLSLSTKMGPAAEHWWLRTPRFSFFTLFFFLSSFSSVVFSFEIPYIGDLSIKFTLVNIVIWALPVCSRQEATKQDWNSLEISNKGHEFHCFWILFTSLRWGCETEAPVMVTRLRGKRTMLNKLSNSTCSMMSNFCIACHIANFTHLCPDRRVLSCCEGFGVNINSTNSWILHPRSFHQNAKLTKFCWCEMIGILSRPQGRISD